MRDFKLLSKSHLVAVVGSILMMFTACSVETNFNEPVVIGVPSYETTTPIPVVWPEDVKTFLSDFSCSVAVSNGWYVIHLDLTGVQDPYTEDWVELHGTGDSNQNIWLELDGMPKGFSISRNVGEAGERLNSYIIRLSNIQHLFDGQEHDVHITVKSNNEDGSILVDKTFKLILESIPEPTFEDGDIFTATTAEGVEMTFKVISASEKTCQVGEGEWQKTSIDKNASGSITIPETVNGLTVKSLGYCAFYNCSKLADITIPNGVTNIGNSAFSQCSGLTYVNFPNSVTSIGSSAFSLCYGLTSINIPKSVIEIDGNPFGYCHGLNNITVDAQNPVYDSRNSCNAIIKKSTNTLIAGCQNTIIPNSVTTLGYYAFNGCSNLTNIVIPNSVTTFEYGVFIGCSKLKSINIPNSVTEIGGNAFGYCNSLTSITVDVQNPKYDSRNQCNAIIETSTNTIIRGCITTTIPQSVTKIGNNAFYACSGLSSMDIPNSINTIGQRAYSYCNDLKSITIPNSVTVIEYRAIENCKNLTSVTSEIQEPFATGSDAFIEIPSNATLYVPAGTKSKYQALADWNRFTNIEETQEWHDGDVFTAQTAEGVEMTFKVISANDKTCQVGTGESNVTCIRWYTSGNITIPTTVKGLTIINIGDYAFRQCSNLTSVIIPNSVTRIGSQAFFNCMALKDLTLPEGIKSIGHQAFDFCSTLTSVTIPKSVEKFEGIAFAGCENVVTIIVDASNPYFDSRDNCNAIIKTASNTLIASCQSTVIPSSVTALGNRAFWCNYNISAIIIPKSITNINYETFENCRSLSSIVVEGGNPIYDSRNNCNAIIETASGTLIVGCNNTIIPTNVTKIGRGAFYGRSLLKNIIITEGVESIDHEAFARCSNLTSITLPHSLTTTGSLVFSDCQKLTSFTFYENIQTIGSQTLYGCSAIRDLYCYAREVPTAASNAFSYWASYATLHVPAASTESYSNTKPWSDFGNIVADYDWTIGTYGDFADIYSAMHDDRVKDGDVLQVLPGTNITEGSYITKAVTIVGNGYEDGSDGYVNAIYIDCENVTLKSLYTGYIYVRHNNATIERCRANSIKGAYNYEFNDATIHGCFVLGSVGGYDSDNNIAYGWNISNNIILEYKYSPVDYLAESTLDHNLIVLYDDYCYNAVGDVTSSSFTNNIILAPTTSQSISNTAVDSATKFEYNIVSNTGNFAKWPTNITGYNNLAKLFVCTGERMTDTYYKLTAKSPALGYANDGGDCGPWSGSFRYLINGKEPWTDPTHWILDPMITTDPQHYKFATLTALVNFMFGREPDEDVTISVTDASYTMDLIPSDLTTGSYSSVDEMLNYLEMRLKELEKGLWYWSNNDDFTISMEAFVEAEFKFNVLKSQAFEYIQSFIAAKIQEMLEQGVTQEEVSAKQAEWTAYIASMMAEYQKLMYTLVDHIETTNITIYIDGKQYPDNPTDWKLDPTLTTNTESHEFATLDALVDYLLNNGKNLEESITVNVADATYNMDVLSYIMGNVNSNNNDVETLLYNLDDHIKEVWDKVLTMAKIWEDKKITINMKAPHEAVFNFYLWKSQALKNIEFFMAQKAQDMLAQGISQGDVAAEQATWKDYLVSRMDQCKHIMQVLTSHITLTNITIQIDPYPIPDPDGNKIDPNDLLALENIYNMLGGSSWTSKKWKVSANKSYNEYTREDFPGVDFDDEGFVVQINLENNNLRGCINLSDWRWLLGLPRLTGLYMQKNNISGDLSPWLNGENRWNRLKALDMSYNNLTEISDTIPSSITSLNLNNQNREWFRPDGISIDPLKIEAMAGLRPMRLYLSAKQTVAMPSLFTYDRESQTHSARPNIYIINEEGMDKYGYFTSSTQDTYSLAWKDGEYAEKQDAPCYVRFDNPFNGSVYPAYLRYINGDANMSGYTDVLDVQTTLNYVLLGGGVWQFNRTAANTYEDNQINVQDIVCMVNIVLNNEAVADSIILSQSNSRRLSRAADDINVQAWLYTEQGRVMLTSSNEMGAIDLELKGVSTSQVSLLLNHSQYQMIGRNTEEGSRYIIFSPTGQPIPATEDVPLLAVSSEPELLAAQAADIEAQEMALAIGRPTGLAQVLGSALGATFQGDDLVVTITTDVQDLSLRLYNAGGQVMLQNTESGVTKGELRMQAPVTPGAYILEMTTRQGGRKIVKLMKR